MKAQLISQKVFESIWNHGIKMDVPVLLIPEAGNLIIMVHDETLYVYKGKPAEYSVLREIDVPDELLRKAEEFSAASLQLMSDFLLFLQPS